MAITFEKVIVLKDIPMFSKASEMALADLIYSAEEKTYSEGEVILEKTVENSDLYIILSGVVKFMDKKEKVYELGARQYFGETMVFSPMTFEQDIVAGSAVTILKISGNAFYNLIALHSSLAYGFIGELSERLRQK